MPRPVCVWCGKPYGNRDTKEERIVVEIGQPIPPPRSNLRVIKERIRPPLPLEGPATPEEAGGYVPMDSGAYEGAPRLKALKYAGRKGREIVRVLWDGESYWGGYNPFCTLRCTLDFARAAYRGGYRRQGGPR